MTPEKLSKLLKEYYVYSGVTLDLKVKAWIELMSYIGKRQDMENWLIGDDLMTLALKKFKEERGKHD